MTKGYKATYNYECRGQTYEIGQEYKLDQKPRICQYGFHYCLDAKHTLDYYNYNKDFKLLEIADLSSDTITEDNKSCSNHIRIIREITNQEELLQLLGEERTFHEDGQQLTYKNSNGFWSEETYNKFGQVLTHNCSDGYSYEYTYDESGKELTYENSTGFWTEYTYDENGKILTRKSGYKQEYKGKDLYKKMFHCTISNCNENINKKEN